MGWPRENDRPRALCARAGARLPADPEQARPGRAAARHLRRRAAAGGDGGALADLGREPLRSVRPDRGSRRHHQRTARALPAPG
jgi:hypothetical protein